MRINPHLCFDGQCEAAFRTYEKLLGGEIKTMLTYGASPMADQFPAYLQDRIIHATLQVVDQELAGADVPSADYRVPQGFYVTLGLADLAKAEHIFRGLAEGGRIAMPLQKTFWAMGFGVLVDRFGVPWEINCA
jgi:PhnB protein